MLNLLQHLQASGHSYTRLQILKQVQDDISKKFNMRREHQYYTYIMMSLSGVLYIGVTNNIDRRVQEHKLELVDGFSKKYQCKKLVYFEVRKDVRDAIAREKQLKRWHRQWKLNLIYESNPTLRDLSLDL